MSPLTRLNHKPKKAATAPNIITNALANQSAYADAELSESGFVGGFEVPFKAGTCVESDNIPPLLESPCARPADDGSDAALAIELKEEMSAEMRDKLDNWIFGCDICQSVCPWNRFAPEYGDSAFLPREGIQTPILSDELKLMPETFNKKFNRIESKNRTFSRHG